MAQWVSMGMSAMQSTKEILGTAQGMAQDQQTFKMQDDARRLDNMQQRNQVVSGIARAGRSRNSGTIYY